MLYKMLYLVSNRCFTSWSMWAWTKKNTEIVFTTGVFDEFLLLGFRAKNVFSPKRIKWKYISQIHYTFTVKAISSLTRQFISFEIAFFNFSNFTKFVFDWFSAKNSIEPIKFTLLLFVHTKSIPQSYWQ